MAKHKHPHYYIKFYVNGNHARTMGFGNYNKLVRALEEAKFSINRFIASENRPQEDIKHKWYVATVLKSAPWANRRYLKAIITLNDGEVCIYYTRTPIYIKGGCTDRSSVFNLMFKTFDEKWYSMRIQNIQKILEAEKIMRTIITSLKG